MSFSSLSPNFVWSKISKTLQNFILTFTFTKFFTFVLVFFLLAGQVNVFAIDPNNITEIIKNDANTQSSTSVAISSSLSSSKNNISSILGSNISNNSTNSQSSATTISSSSLNSFFTSNPSLKTKSKIESLPKKVNLLKKKSLNFQNDVNISDDWWLEGGSGNNTKLANTEIKTFIELNEGKFVNKSLPIVKLAIIDSGIDTSFSANSKIDFDIDNSIRYYSTFEDPNCNFTNSYLPIPEVEIDASGSTTGNLVDSTTNFYCRTIGSQFDNDSHGTAVTYVAGQVLNSNNQILDSSIQVLPIAMHGYALDTFMLADAIRYATDQGSSVINMSIGSPYKDNILKSAIRYAQQKGVIIVASSGNCGTYTAPNCDTDGDGIQTIGNEEELDNAPNYPASYTGVIAVGASNFEGSCPVDLINNACPVIDKAIYSNSASNLFVVAPLGNGIVVSGIGEEAGTSFSAPQVSGAIVKMMAIKNLLSIINPEVNSTSSNVLDWIKDGATDILKEDYTPGLYTNKGVDFDTGNGLLNLVGSWKMIRSEFTNLKSQSLSQNSSNNPQQSGGLITVTINSSSSSSSSAINDLINRVQYKLQSVDGTNDPSSKGKVDIPNNNRDQEEFVENMDKTPIGKGAATVRTGGYSP